ncbi:FKBP-type peptidyl-prolyl cis-trans isomerase [Planctomycetota bacterium]|nr:FKBP-type peptidyl-prolyl cis-trans isomerase [Planctomycetota bacterium]
MKMKQLAVGGLLGLMVAGAPLLVWAQNGQEAAPQQPSELNMQELMASMQAPEVDIKKASYALGLNVAMQLKAQEAQFKQMGVELDLAEVVKGLDAGLEKPEEEWAMKSTEARDMLQQFSQMLMMKQMAKAQEMQSQMEAEAGSDASTQFLAQNKEAEGVVALPSGLQYKVIEEGEGESPTAADTVVVDYEGTLVNGQVFDSSFERGEPIEFPLNGVIPGWTEGVQLMKPGATYMLYVPADLAYGKEGRPPQIPGDATLIFKVKLHEVKKANAGQ